MITVAEHRDRILAAVHRLPTEHVHLTAAHGRVLAADLVSAAPVPAFDNSAMDGYAVRRADVLEPPVTLRIVADVPAGSAEDPRIGAGEAARIMTGAAVPSDADAIVPLEQTDAGTAVTRSPHAEITVLAAPREHAHIRRAGEDAAANSLVLVAGTVLGARQLSAAAAAGAGQLSVLARPRVAVIATGDELVAPGEPLRRGQIPESNSTLLAACASEAGALVTSVTRVSDDEDGLRAAIHAAAADADVVILSGGVSVGAFDVVRAVLEPAGIRFENVAMQPGKPQGFGTRDDGTMLFCLPGNPVSSFISFEAFVRPALRRLAGHTTELRPARVERVATGWTCPPGRAQFMPIRFTADGVVPSASRGSGSHLVTSLALAEGIALVDANIDTVREADHLDVWELTP
ncbi:molybdopterin molybdotransferase MoeA [Okibacterium endophyticum]